MIRRLEYNSHAMDNQSSMPNSLLGSSLHVAEEFPFPVDIKAEGDEDSNIFNSALQTEDRGIEDPLCNKSGCEFTTLRVKPYAKLAKLNTSSLPLPASNKATAYYFNGTHYVRVTEATVPPQLPTLHKGGLRQLNFINHCPLSTEDPSDRETSTFRSHKADELADIKDDSLPSAQQFAASHLDSKVDLDPVHSGIIVKSEIDLGTHYVRVTEATVPPQLTTLPEGRSTQLNLINHCPLSTEDPSDRETSTFRSHKADELTVIKNDSLPSAQQSVASHLDSKVDLDPVHSGIVEKSEIDLGTDTVPCRQGGIKVEQQVTIDVEIDNPLSRRNLSLSAKRKRLAKLKHENCFNLNASNGTFEIAKSLPLYNPKGTRSCKACGYRTNDFEAWINHTKYYHTQKNQFQCLQCPAKNPSLNHLIYHYNTVHLCKKLKQCKTCGIGYKCPISYAKHKTKCVSLKPWACNKCDFTAKFEHLLKRHLERHWYETKVPCPYCGREVRRRWLDSHIANQHRGEQRNHMCEICSKVFGSKRDVDRHRKEHQQFPCRLCDYRGTNEMLDTHMATHKNEVFICEHEGCGRWFLEKESFDKHLSIHSIPKEKLFICEFDGCKATYKIHLNLRFHYRQTKHNRPYLCLKCNRRFVEECSLTNHYKKKHQDESKFDPNSHMIVENTENIDDDSVEARVAHFGTWLGISSIEGDLNENDSSSATIRLDSALPETDEERKQMKEKLKDTFESNESKKEQTTSNCYAFPSKSSSGSSLAIDFDQKRPSKFEGDVFRKTDSLGISGSTRKMESTYNENHPTQDSSPEISSFIPDIGGYLECKVECVETDLNEDFKMQAVDLQTNQRTVNRSVLTGEIGCLVEIKQEITDTESSGSDFAAVAMKTEKNMEN